MSGKNAGPHVGGPATLGYWRDILLILAICITGLALGGTLLVPLVLAILSLVLLLAIVDRIERFGLPRFIAHIIAAALVVLGLIGGLMILSNQAVEIADAAPRYAARFSTLFSRLVSLIGENNATILQEKLATLDVSDAALGTVNIASATLSGLFLVLLYIPFMIAERNPMATKIRLASSDPGFQQQISAVTQDISLGLQRYVGIKTFVSLLTGLLSYAIMKPVGLDFAETWAVLAFALNFIPSIGSMLGVILPAAMALIQFDTMGPFLIVVLGCGAVQFVIGNVLEPALTGRSLNLSPLMVILALTFWSFLWGIPGALLSVPITVCIMIVFSNIPGTRALAILMSGDGLLKGDTTPKKPVTAPGADPT